MCYRISSLLFFWIHTLESKQLRYLHLVVIWCTFGLIFHKCPVLAMKSQISTLWFNSTLHKLSPIFLMVVILYMVLHFSMSTLLNVWKYRKPWQTRDFHYLFSNGCHSLLSSSLLYVYKRRIPWQTGDFHDHNPILPMVVILYLVLHFSMCRSVEYREKLGIFTTISPSFCTVVILYLVLHFSMCRSVEYCDKRGIFTTFSPSLPRLSFFT